MNYKPDAGGDGDPVATWSTGSPAGASTPGRPTRALSGLLTFNRIQDLCRRLGEWAVLGIYALASVLLTWPAMGRLDEVVPGRDTDVFVHLWNFDWVLHSLTQGQNPYFAPLLFYPDGAPLYSHNFPWLNIFLWVPLQAVMGSDAAYTLAFLLVLVLNGYLAYLFFREMGHGPAAAFVAGLLVLGWPYLVSRQSSPNLSFIAPVPLVMLALHRLVRRGLRRDLLLLAVSLALLGLARFQWLLLGMVLIAPFALVTLWRHGNGLRPIRQLLIGGVAAAVLLLPTAGPLLWYQFTREFPEDVATTAMTNRSTDLVTYVDPQRSHPIWNRWATPGKILTYSIYGLSLLLLTGIGIWAYPRRAGPWLLLAGVCFVLSLGNSLVIGETRYMKLPDGWLDALTGDLWGAVVRQPARFNAPLILPWAMVIAYGVTYLIRRFPARQLLWISLLGGIMGVEALHPLPTQNLYVFGWYDSLLQEPGEFGLVQIPMERNSDESYMLYQRIHGKAMVSGHISRPPREVFAYIESVPLLAHIRVTSVEGFPGPPPDASLDPLAQLAILASDNFRYLVLHKRFMDDSLLFEWMNWLTVRPSYEDDQVVVYATQVAGAGQRYPVAPGISILNGGLFPAATAPGGRIEAQIDWRLRQPSALPTQICLTAELPGGGTQAEGCTPLPWDNADGLIGWSGEISIPAQGGPGGYEIWGRLLGADGNPMGDPFLLGMVNVWEAGPRLAPPAGPGFAPIPVGDELRLVEVGHAQTNVAGVFFLHLSWQAVTEMTTDYKFFVHLIDEESGLLAAQVDYMPRDWEYPTTRWQRGEVVAETARLPINHLAPGRYRVMVGVYHPETGLRLPPQAGAQYPVQDQALQVEVFRWAPP